MKKGAPNITVILPAFNEEIFIGSIVLRTRQHADRVIVVHDGSMDNTAEVAGLAGAEVIRHPENRGKGTALKTGFQAATGADIIVIMDSGGEHNPDRIPEIIDPIKNEGYDIVISPLSCSKKSYNKENLLSLNKKKPYNTKTGFLALSIASLKMMHITNLTARI